MYYVKINYTSCQSYEGVAEVKAGAISEDTFNLDLCIIKTINKICQLLNLCKNLRLTHCDLIDLFEDGIQLKISSQIQLPLAEVLRDNLGFFYYWPPKKQARRTLSSRSFLSLFIFKRQFLVLVLIYRREEERVIFFSWLSDYNCRL